MKEKILLSALIFSLAVLNGCSVGRPSTSIKSQSSFEKSGVISISRLAPEELDLTKIKKLGFLPARSEHDGSWLLVDLSQKTATLMDGSKPAMEAKVQGNMQVSPGVYKIVHKQRSPLWYAGDEYFQNRGMSVPVPGDNLRYLRGALGDFALFIDKDTSIHSAEVWSPEVGGLRISDDEIRKIYYSVDVGSIIEIR